MNCDICRGRIALIESFSENGRVPDVFLGRYAKLYLSLAASTIACDRLDEGFAILNQAIDLSAECRKRCYDGAVVELGGNGLFGKRKALIKESPFTKGCFFVHYEGTADPDGSPALSLFYYPDIEACVCPDGRVRGLLQFYGANRTGRWAGRLVQVQNLPRTYTEPLELARDLVKRRNLDGLKLVYGSANDTLLF